MKTNIVKVMERTIRIVCLLIVFLAVYNFLKEDLSDALVSEFVFIVSNAIGLLILSFIPAYIKKKGIEVPNLLTAIFLIFMTLALLFGEIFGFYKTVKHWDSVLHFSSGALIGLVAFSLVNLLNNNEKLIRGLSPLFIAIFAFSFAMTMGVLWEIAEFTLDGLFGSNMQRFRHSITNIGFTGRQALMDTMKDFILNTLGALIAAMIGYAELKSGDRIVKYFTLKKTRRQGELNENEELKS